MARGSKTTESQSKKKGDAAKEGRVALKDAPAKGRRGRSEAEPEAPVSPAPRVFDERTRRDIAGVGIAVAAVVLFVTAVLPPSGFITSALAEGLHMALGLGAYVLPFALAAVGACFLVRGESDTLAVRMGIGLAMLFVAFEALLSLFVAGADADSSLLFVRDALISRGGYLGAGIAWALLELLGRVVGAVVMFGLAVAGAVVIGFSVSGALLSARDALAGAKERYERRREAREEREEATALDSPAYQAASSEPSARIVRRPDPPRVPRDLSRPRRASQSLSTQVLGAARSAQGGPATSSVDMYWPSDYAYDEARAIADEGRAAEAKKTRVVGVEKGIDEEIVSGAGPQAACEPSASRIAPVADSEPATPARTRRLAAPAPVAASAPKSEPTRHVLPWEDEPPAAMPEALVPEAPMPPVAPTRRLERPKADAPFERDASPFEGNVESVEPEAPVASAPTRALGKPARPASGPSASSAPRETGGGFVLPAFSLIRHSEHAAEADERELSATAAALQGTLEDFNIMATVVGWVAGPTVTLFKVDLPSGVRVSRIMALQDDIALALAAPGVRIFAPIPGTNHVGIEVPNKQRQNVLLGDVIKDAKGAPLEMAIGKDVEGHSIVTDLAKMPHLLIGGTTGSGKSVAINAMIMSILMRATPDEVRFIMIDPKRVEFTPYNGIPHLYVPVVTENKEAASALAWGVAEMERRLKVMSKAGVRNIGQYNAKVAQGAFDDADEADAEPAKKMPYIVIIIDELADLMMNVGKEVELSISRIAQLARAAGIHMIVATQRPSTNVVTGLIKANITNRIAFNVASGIDSRVILDTPGAENLIGLGDMLFSKPEYAKPQRLQGCFVSEDEIEAVVAHLKEQGEPEYHQEILQTNVIGLGSSMPDGSGGSSSSDDPLLWEAADIVVASGLGSTSNIQRRLSVGYSRAGRIMDMLEEKGVVGPPNGSKPREVLVDAMELETLKAFEAQDAAEGF